MNVSKCPEVEGGMRCLRNRWNEACLDPRDGEGEGEGDNESLDQVAKLRDRFDAHMRSTKRYRRSQPGLVPERHMGSAVVSLEGRERGTGEPATASDRSGDPSTRKMVFMLSRPQMDSKKRQTTVTTLTPQVNIV